jgi:hypothetical protein
MSTNPVKPYFVRQRMLGSEAVYRVLEEGDSVVTVEVVHAPGLAQGTHIRLLARAVRAMEHLDPATEPTVEPTAVPDSITVTPRFSGA